MFRLLEEIPYPSIPTAYLGDLHPITCYSEYYDGRVEYNSTATLRHFTKPQLQQDLAIGYPGWVAQHSQRPPGIKPFCIQPLDEIIEACLRSENSDQLLKAQVITKRGILYQLSERQRLLVLNVCLIDGRLFVEQHDTKPDESRLNWLMYIGHAFKEACTSGPRFGDWSTVVARTIGGINVLFGATVDCIKDPNHDYHQSENFIQMKTVKQYKSRPQATNWLLYERWYMQAHLLGIPSIYVGYRHYKKPKDLLFETENKPIETLLPPPESIYLFDPAKSTGRIHRILRALLQFTSSEQQKSDEIRVWRAEVSFDATLDIEEVPPAELDLNARIGIVKEDHVDRIRNLY